MDTLAFIATFESTYWSGNLLSYQVTANGIAATPSWKAADQLPTPGNRNIFVTTGGSAQSFEWANLSPADQALLGSKDVVDFLRGDRSKELSNTGSFRNRGRTALGDIVHSPPFYVEDSDTVFVGANDGMLHAFNGKTGAERFAYIPSAVVPKLKGLSDPGYLHTYFVDGDIAVSDDAATPGSHYLVASTGRGARGLFALDVTHPASFGSGDLLWEYFDSLDNDLGFMLGELVIAKTNDGSTVVIAGNGYNSNSGEAYLYVFDLASGNLIRKIPTGVAGNNGLSSPTVLDTDNDDDVDYVYAGDLLGNVWKFDLTDSQPVNWDVRFGPGQPLFTAQDPSNNPQPITGPVSLAYDTKPGSQTYGKLFVFFGTGSYIFASDPSDTQVQSWYGIIDEDIRIAGRTDLKERMLDTTGKVNNKDVRTFEAATAGDMAGMKGWFIDLPAGERMVTGSTLFQLAEPTLIASSIVPRDPADDPCKPGGQGYLNAIDPFTGGATTFVVFDLNNDQRFDAQDNLGSDIVGSVDLGVGMAGRAILVGDQLVVGGSGGKGGKLIDSVRVNLGAPAVTGRLMWREIIRN